MNADSRGYGVVGGIVLVLFVLSGLLGAFNWSRDGDGGDRGTPAATAVAVETTRSVATVVAPERIPISVALTQPTVGSVVFHNEVLKAEVTGGQPESVVEFLADREVVATASFDAGESVWTAEWDTTTNVDSEVSLTVRVVDQYGETLSDPVLVVATNDTYAEQRLAIDFEADRISVDEYVKFGVWSLTFPDELLPERYAGKELPPEVDELGPEAFMVFFQYWEELEPTTRADLETFLDHFLTMRDDLALAVYQDALVEPGG